MTAFHFRLERVLRWRLLESSSEETKLKRLIAEGAALDATLARIRRAIEGIPAQIAAIDDLRGRDLNCIAAYNRHLIHEREKAATRCRAKKQEIAAQTQIHATAKQRVRLLEELRNRKQQAWRHETNVELEQLAQESFLARWTQS